jgi:hypothetical protein
MKRLFPRHSGHRETQGATAPHLAVPEGSRQHWFGRLQEPGRHTAFFASTAAGCSARPVVAPLLAGRRMMFRQK